MESGKTSLAARLLAVVVAAVYLAMVAYMVTGMAKAISTEMARVRKQKPSSAMKLGAQVGRLLPMLRRLR